MVSVVVPIYNGKHYLGQIIKRTEEARRRNLQIEVLFINDAPDDPIDISVSSDIIPTFVFNTEINRGIQGARIFGLSQARGEYIHFLDQDDEVFPEFYASQLALMEDADVVFCRAYDGDVQVYNNDRIFEAAALRESMFQKPPMISPGQALIRKSAIPDIWKENVLTHMGADDYMLWLMMLSRGVRFKGNDRILFRHTRTGINLSGDILKMNASDREMVEILLKCTDFSERDKEEISRIPERQFMRKYRSMLRNQTVLYVLNRILAGMDEGRMVSAFFLKRGIRRIAIYGAGVLSERIRGFLKGSDVKVCFLVDHNAPFITSDLQVYLPGDMPQDVDGVLISLIDDVEKIEDKIRNKYKGIVIRVTDIIAS